MNINNGQEGKKGQLKKVRQEKPMAVVAPQLSQLSQLNQLNQLNQDGHQVRGVQLDSVTRNILFTFLEFSAQRFCTPKYVFTDFQYL